MLALAISKLQRGRAGLRQAYNGIGSKYRLLTGSIPKKKVGVGAVIGEPVSAGLNSLLLGKVQGIFAEVAEGAGSRFTFCLIDQLARARFPKLRNREIF